MSPTTPVYLVHNCYINWISNLLVISICLCWFFIRLKLSASPENMNVWLYAHTLFHIIPTLPVILDCETHGLGSFSNSFNKYSLLHILVPIFPFLHNLFLPILCLLFSFSRRAYLSTTHSYLIWHVFFEPGIMQIIFLILPTYWSPTTIFGSWLPPTFRWHNLQMVYRDSAITE